MVKGFVYSFKNGAKKAFFRTGLDVAEVRLSSFVLVRGPGLVVSLREGGIARHWFGTLGCGDRGATSERLGLGGRRDGEREAGLVVLLAVVAAAHDTVLPQICVSMGSIVRPSASPQQQQQQQQQGQGEGQHQDGCAQAVALGALACRVFRAHIIAFCGSPPAQPWPGVPMN